MFNATFSSGFNHTNSSTNLRTSGGRLLWYLYPECASAPYCFAFYYGAKVFNLFLGTPCNILVIWQIATKKTNSSTSDIFFFNLALIDAFFCLMTPIDLLNRMVYDNKFIWYIQRLAYGLKDLSPFFLVCICLDRYMAVVHPVLYSGYRDKNARVVVCVVVWVLMLPYSITKSILGILSVTDIFSGVILFAFAVMVFCNISVVWVLRRSVAGKEVMHPVKKKAFKMVMKNLAIIVVNYLPPVAIMPFLSYFTVVDYLCFISISVFGIMDLSCSIEPLLYITKMEKVDAICCRQSISENPPEANG
ncbi:proteinase-activated receptor 3 [Nothobranchius furzeri]|uniref:proteinase-activated receptor 3 n=1 Tax=Nothobranchius furzeri TaxID=105023 RepID=UPI00240419AD|nr:proteinase-activated receptor 3-like [Nothobranchius furzeri]